MREWFEYDQGYSGHSFRAIWALTSTNTTLRAVKVWSLGNAENRLSSDFFKACVVLFAFG